MHSVSPSSNSQSQSDYLARTIKLSPCYFYFYLVQIVMACVVCSLMYLERTELIPYVQIAIAFSICLDIILTHFGSSGRSCLSKVSAVNLLVLLGCLTSITLDLTIPQETHNKANTIFGMMLVSRYAVQSIWVVKLISESKKIIEMSKLEYISFEANLQIDEQIRSSRF